MKRIIKNTMLNYLPKKLSLDDGFNKNRIFDFNNKEIKKGLTVYLIERELRAYDNFALYFAAKLQKEIKADFKIIHHKKNYEFKNKENFINGNIKKVQKEFQNLGFDFEIFEGSELLLLEYLKKIKTGVLIVDFNPINKKEFLFNAPFKIFEIDDHNIIPAKILTDKKEYGAQSLRRKIYLNVSNYLTDFIEPFEVRSEADLTLLNFIQNKLPFYFEFKNNPNKNFVSDLSKFLNLGFISKKRVAIEIFKSNAGDENKEAFFEELIVQNELSENFCYFEKNFKSINSAPTWAKESLFNHKNDIKEYFYNLSELENFKTHDILWNATQKELIKNGKIFGYLRMYWAKKILEWSNSPEVAIKNAIYLNDKYSYDSPSPNGYSNILWAIAGVHDRAFKDYFITGKIRRMTFNSMKKKFDIFQYIDRINS